MKNDTRNTNYYGLAAGVTLAALIVIIGLMAVGRAGYTLQGFRLVQTGSIEIAVPEGSVVFLGDERALPKNGRIANLPPGTHELLVAKDGHYPWAKKITVLPGGTVRVAPFMVPGTTTGLAIGTKDPEFASLQKSFRTAKLPSASAKLTGPSGTALWVDKNEIFISRNGQTESVFKGTSPIKSVGFYKGRSDVVMFASGENIFAIETDKTGTQNFQPVYKGTDPHFLKKDDASIYVKEGAALMIVDL